MEEILLIICCGYNLNQDEKFASQDIKQKGCFIALNYEEELKLIEPFYYDLLDGNNIIIKEERINCPEISFNPKL